MGSLGSERPNANAACLCFRTAQDRPFATTAKLLIFRHPCRSRDIRATAGDVRAGRLEFELRAQGGHYYFSLRALAARKLLQVPGLACRSAAANSAMRTSRSEIFMGNSQVPDEAPIRCSYSNGRFRVNLNSNSKAPDALHQALLSQVTSILLDSEDVEIVDVCHHTVVPPA